MGDNVTHEDLNKCLLAELYELIIDGRIDTRIVVVSELLSFEDLF